MEKSSNAVSVRISFENNVYDISVTYSNFRRFVSQSAVFDNTLIHRLLHEQGEFFLVMRQMTARSLYNHIEFVAVFERC